MRRNRPSDRPPALAAVRRVAAERLVPLALLLLPVCVAVAVWRAWTAERSHRLTAEHALRDYAAFAAWQLDRQVRGLLTQHVAMSLRSVREIARAGHDSLAAPAELLAGAAHCNCRFRTETRFAFRMAMRDGRPAGGAADVAATVALPAATREAILRELPLGGLQPLTMEGACSGGEEALRRASRLHVAELDGRPVVITYAVVADRAGAARAVYGLVADARHLAESVDRELVRGQPLLPASLVGGLRNDSLLAIRIAPAGWGGRRPVYESARAPSTWAYSAADTLPPALGSLVTTAALRPEVAATLTVGGLPRSQLPLSLALLAGSGVVSLVALAQLRRSRELARLRSRFVANVSHELRTPLTQISMFSETLMLDRERSAEERRHFLSVIFREARRLTNLVDGVLRFSRGEGGGGAGGVRPEPRDVSADVREAVHAFAPLAAAAEVAVALDAPDGAWAAADHGALRQVLLNLLDNAVKYGPAGQSVTVRVARAAGEARIAVEDEGVGIAPEDRARVFEPFARVERPGAPRVSGSGIGLTIVRDLVTAHGGRVWIEDGARGRGTRVVVALRAAAAPSEHAVTPSATRHSERSEDSRRATPRSLAPLGTTGGALGTTGEQGAAEPLVEVGAR